MSAKPYVAPSAVQPTCVLAHGFVNNLAIIVGECELLASSVTSPAGDRRLGIIKDMALEIVKTLNSHKCTCASPVPTGENS